jgi:phage-related protein
VNVSVRQVAGMAVRTIRYVNNAAKKAVQKLPQAVAIDFLNDLNFVAAGKEPRSPFKHLPELGAGVMELIENGSPAYRLVYCAKFLDTVFVLHAFTKTTNGVDKKAMATVKDRYKEMMAIIRDEEKRSRAKD